MKPIWTWPHLKGVTVIHLDDDGGAFWVRHERMYLKVIASFGEGWDHVSVSTERRCPTWEELEHVKRLFFKDDETAMQLHLPPSDHINIHPYVLHLWRPQKADIPLPPKDFV